MSIATFRVVRTSPREPERPPGARDGDRTRIAGLEGQSSTIELLPHSERPDSNRRPQRPERCALTKLRHSPFGCRLRYSIVTNATLPSRKTVRTTPTPSPSPDIVLFHSSTDSIG